VVVPRNAAQVTAEDLIGFCKARLAHFKYPRIVEFSTGLPRVAVGKIKRSAL
jgi:acyl-CoA synthetase (AMP-forming)/AMP-acid ligase II